MLYRGSSIFPRLSSSCQRKPITPQCSQLPGTLLRIFIPPGAVINLLNLVEVASPSGICFIIRLPFLGGSTNLDSIVSSIQSAGGTVDFV